MMGILIAVLSLAVFFFVKTNDKIVSKTYCSDECPLESEWVPFQVYKNYISPEDCAKQGDTPNYAYGWRNDYLGCTPRGAKTLSDATEEMWQKTE